MGLFSKLLLKIGEATAKSGPPPLKANKNRIISVRYSVKGKNPDTGRIKKLVVVSESTACMEEVQQISGLLPPYEIEKIDPEPPTDKQIAYAKELGIAFPTDASVRDATIFLTRYEEGLPLIQPATPDRLVRYLTGKGIFVHAYAGMNETSALYLNGVSFVEKAAFFCMRVFCDLKNRSYCLLEDASPVEKDLFFKFANLHEMDKAFIKSLSFYSCFDLPLDSCPSLKKIKAYNIAADFLKNEGAV